MISDYNFAKNKLLKNDIELLTKNISNEIINNHLKQNDKTCIICLDRPRDTVVQPCGHVLACEDCVMKLVDKINIIQSATCPICRVWLQNIEIYKINTHRSRKIDVRYRLR